jgi:hypothetical protein
MAFLAALFLAAGIVYVVDPFQHYRKASFYKPVYDYNRYLNPGLAKNWDYDNVIVGTSMVMSFYRPYVDKVFDAETLNLGIPYATPDEQRMMFDSVARAGKAKRVIYGLDAFMFAAPRYNMGLNPFPFYMYYDSLLNDYKYLISYLPLKVSYYIFEWNILGKKQQKFNMDRLFAEVSGEPLERYKIEYIQALNRKKQTDVSTVFERMVDNFDSAIVPAMKEYKDIEFEIFFPPYSYLFWLNDIQTSKITMGEMLQFKRHVYDSLKGVENVRLYDFQSEEDITFDLKNYADTVHFISSIGNIIIDSIAAGSNLVTDETIFLYEDELRRQIEAVDVEELNKSLGLE